MLFLNSHFLDILVLKIDAVESRPKWNVLVSNCPYLELVNQNSYFEDV